MQGTIPICFVLSAVAVSSTSTAQEQEGLLGRLTDLTQARVEGGAASGLAVVLEVGGKELWSHAAGRIHLDDARPITTTTQVPASSLTELLTSLVAMQLVSSGDMDFHAPLSEYVEGLSWKAETVSMHHLLTHTSGIPEIECPNSGAEGVEDFFGQEDLWKQVVGEALHTVPGSCQGFSGTNTYLAGMVCQVVTDKPLAKLVRDGILNPLNMSATGFEAEGGDGLGALSYGVQVAGFERMDTTGAARFGARKLVTSAQDMVRLMRGLVGNKIIDGAGWAHLLGSHRTGDGQELQYAHGVSKTEVGPFAGVAFGGASGHVRIHLAYYPSLDIIVSMSGDCEAGVLEQLRGRLVREVFDLPLASVAERVLPEGALASYVGVYKLGCDRLELLGTDDGRLVFAGGARPEHVMLYQGADTFVAADDHGIRIQLQVERGQAHSLILTEHGSSAMAVRLGDHDD